MKFDWGRSLYLALRWSIYGTIVGFIFGFVIGIGRQNFEAAPAFAIAFFWLFGIGRLGFEALTKRYPDA